MTPDQATQLAERITIIKLELRDLANTNTHITTDNYEANQQIAQLRNQLQDIDLQLFQCYRIIENFSAPVSRSTSLVREQRAPTIDDLEI